MKAAGLLHGGKTVLGPSIDGGDYLIGLSRKAFNDLNFLDFEWQTCLLHEQFKKACDDLSFEVSLLDPLQDIDTQEDFFRILGQGKLSQSFTDFFLCKIGIQFFTPKNNIHILGAFARITSLRAPPIAA